MFGRRKILVRHSDESRCLLSCSLPLKFTSDVPLSYLGRDPLGVEPPVTTNTAFSPSPSSSLARALTVTEATPGYVSNKRENEATGPATWPADRRATGREGAGRRRRLQSRKRARERNERTSPSSSSDACTVGERAEKSSERRETPLIAGATGNLLGDAFHWAGKNNAHHFISRLDMEDYI